MRSAYNDGTGLLTVLQRFCLLAGKSQVFLRESRSRSFSALVETRDPRGALYLLLDHGRVLAGAGGSRSEAQRAANGGFTVHGSPATLRFELSAQTLHEVLTGSIHPVQLAFTGRVKVYGNIFSALSLQALLPEAIRLYGVASASI